MLFCAENLTEDHNEKKGIKNDHTYVDDDDDEKCLFVRHGVG